MRRERITITLKKNLVHEADKLINSTTIRSRSQAIEILLTKAVKKYKISGALVLAGGKTKIGKAIKSMALVNDKPVLEHIIKILKDSGIENIVIYTDYESSKITSYFKDGKKFGVSIDYIVMERPVGRAIPIKMASEHFDDTFLVYYGDTLCNLDIEDMIRNHKDSASVVTVALTTVSDPGKYGVVNMKGSHITSFVEKPKKFGSYLVSAGIFLVEPSVPRNITNKMFSLETDLFPKLAKKGQLYGYPFEGIWLNINDSKALRKANKRWK